MIAALLGGVPGATAQTAEAAQPARDDRLRVYIGDLSPNVLTILGELGVDRRELGIRRVAGGGRRLEVVLREAEAAKLRAIGVGAGRVRLYDHHPRHRSRRLRVRAPVAQ
ncbi:MAG: hypothetical protein H0W51_05550 [Euzebyales bacterium]|nr:hypothetical protein [Euzebyales bacterium]